MYIEKFKNCNKVGSSILIDETGKPKKMASKLSKDIKI